MASGQEMTDKQVDLNETVDSSEFLERTAAITCPQCGLAVTGGFTSCPNDGTKLLPDLQRDSALSDRYDSLELIGEGGMSSIYKARHKIMKRTVAIKLLHSHFHSNADTVRRFQQEAEAISSLAHDNVVNVFDFGQLQHGQPYMVMNYVPGRSLSQAIKEDGPLELSRALKIFSQICLGLDHAHKKHIVHRDLKPTNVMLTKDDAGQDRAIIVDFGIAKFIREGEQTAADLTKTGAVIGSPYYMSPEQCLGRMIDRPSDIYSLGCLMYETLVGKPIFAGGSSLETMHRHINDKAPDLPSINGNQQFKPLMQAIIHHAVEKEPGNRYQTAAELEHDIALLSSSMQKGTVPKLRELKACSKLRIKPIPVAVAVGVTVVACALQMGFWWNQPVGKEPVALGGKAFKAKTKPSASDDKSLTQLVAAEPNLTELLAIGITGKGIPTIGKLANLEKLSLSRCTADDTALSGLSRLTKLKDLSLKDSKIDDKCMDALGNITSLKKLLVMSNSMTDAGFSSLSKLTNLQELAVQNIKVLGPGVKQLAKLPHLTSLCLLADSAAEIHDSALKIIADSLPNLKTLKLESTQLTDEALISSLNKFKGLERLSVSFSPKITDKGMTAIAALNLKWLNVNGTEVTDAGLKLLTGLKNLEQIFFWHTRVTDNGMQYLGSMKNLKVLHLTHTAVSDVGLAKLIGLNTLIDLKLKDTKITDDGLKLLKQLPHLEKLSLEALQISDAGIKEICNIPSLKMIDLSGTLITDAGLKQLSASKHLGFIYLKDCHGITPKGVEELQKLLPNCVIDTTQSMPSRAYD